MTFAILWWFFAIYGVSLALTTVKKGHIGKLLSFNIPIIRDGLKCPVCTSFWITIPVSIWIFSPSSSMGAPWSFVLAVTFDAFAMVALVFIAHAIVMRVAPEDF